MAPVAITIDPSQWVDGSTRWTGGDPGYETAERGSTHTHVYGIGTGQFGYGFPLASVAWSSADVTARLSSELSNSSALVTLIVNDVSYPAKRVIPHNGSGADYNWRIDPRVLRPGANTLAFAVTEEAQHHHGLCIYYRSVVPDKQDAPIVVRLQP